MAVYEEYLTSASQQTLALAQEYALHHGAASVEPQYLLLALLSGKTNTAQRTLSALQQHPDHLRAALAERLPPANQSPEKALPLSRETQDVLHDAYREAQLVGHQQIDPVHVLAGVLYDTDSAAARLLTDNGLTLYDVRQQLLQQREKYGGKRASTATLTTFLPSPAFLVLIIICIASGFGLTIGGSSGYISSVTLVFVLTGWVISVCIHEYAHALAAYHGGDLSVKDSGYLSLDPFRYTHPLFSIAMPIVFLLIGGLGLPGGAVYIYPQNLRTIWWRSFASLAGPLGTLLMALLIAAPFVLGIAPVFTTEQSAPFWSALAFLGFLQITALLFNLLPIPPLDGFGILEPFMPSDVAFQIRRYSGLLFITLLLILWYSPQVSSAFFGQAFFICDQLGIPLFLIIEGSEQFLFWR